MISAVAIITLAASAFGNPLPASNALQTRQSCTINSLASAAAVGPCKIITIEGLTLLPSEKLVINAADNAVINMQGDIVFKADTSFQTTGPLFTLTGTGITFNGNGHTINGEGENYWDGLGTAANARTKPHPMIKLSCSGTVQNFTVLNSPAQVFSMGNDAALLVSDITINNSAGDAVTTSSNQKPAAHNTDGFDVSTNDVTIQNSIIHNQDDCIAINKGSNIVFQNNQCNGGHGISIGSVASGSTVSKVQIIGNTITNNVQALRIKTDAAATSGSVSGVTYKDNTATGCTSYGVIIDQSYPATLSTSTGAGVKISDINFTGTNSISIDASAKGEVEVNCAQGGCTGAWNWSGLKVSGGPSGTILNANVVSFTP